jgi:tetratricopeptide (TPR) repeat protein
MATLASGVAVSTAMLAPSPVAALTSQETLSCVKAFARDPHISACQAAVLSVKCANLDTAYGREEQISACTAASQSASWSSRDMAEIFINRGTAYQVNDDLDGAIADYAQAIRLDPGIGVAFYDRGLVYEDKGDLDRAIADFGQAVRVDDDFASAFTSLGDAYREKGDPARAIAAYNEALRLGDKSDHAFTPFETFYGRATAYRSRGDFARAIADYDAANRLIPDTRVVVNRGLTYLAKGDVDRAIADYSQAIDDDPEDPDHFLDRGVANLYSGRLRQSLKDLTQAADAGGDEDAYIMLWLNIAEVRSKRPSRLAGDETGVDMKAWPAPIIRLYLGETTYEAVLTAAADPAAKTKAARLCDTNFFAGELALQRAEKAKAARLLRLATAAECGITIAWAANAELKTLGLTTANSRQGRPAGYPHEGYSFPRYPIEKSTPPLPAPPPAKQPLSPKTTISL